METRLPVEVELAYEVMSCQAMRIGAGARRSSRTRARYFRKWGTYHSYDYTERRRRRPSPGSCTRRATWGARRSCRSC